VYDDETGYYYLKARYYNPEIARFITEDTYRGKYTDPLSLNRYMYALNNPVIYIDPTGNIAWLNNMWNSTTQAVEGAWDASTRVAGEAWDTTKQVTGEAWDTTTRVIGEAVDASKQFAFGGSKVATEGNVESEMGFLDKAGKVLYASSEIVLGGFTTAGGVALVGSSGIATVMTGGGSAPVSIPVAVGGGIVTAHGANSVSNGVNDFKLIFEGEWEQVGTENILRDEVYEPGFSSLGESLAELVGADGEKGAEYGEMIGTGAYYVADFKTGIDGTINGVKALKQAQWTRGAFVQGSKGIVTLETLEGHSTTTAIYSNLAKNAVGYYYNLDSAGQDFMQYYRK
jgi:RHS repeat-associated protein